MGNVLVSHIAGKNSCIERFAARRHRQRVWHLQFSMEEAAELKNNIESMNSLSLLLVTLTPILKVMLAGTKSRQAT